MLEKLAEARMRQARAMERFTLARTRVLRAEKRFQAIREHSVTEEQAPSDVPPLPEMRQDPAPGEDALIAAILAITQTEPASPPADDPSLEETVHLAERVPHQARQQAPETDPHPSSGQEAEKTDTTARLPIVRQQRASEPD